MASWPSDLPQYASPEQYEELPRMAAVEVPMDAGIPKSFREGTDDGRRFRITLPFDGTQRDSFDAFWRGDLRDGEAVFDWVLPREQTATKFAFMEKPTYEHVDGDIYNISMRLQERAPDLLMGARIVSSTKQLGQLAVGATFTAVVATGSRMEAD